MPEDATIAPGVLYLLPVPLSDVAPAEVLTAAELSVVGRLRHFVVENLRTARRFLKACDRGLDINALTLTELSEHTAEAEVEDMLGPLLAGDDLGVVSEAGCPAVADPGASLVAAAQRRGIRVVPMTGPSSILLSLMASGFNGQKFAFEGYMPIDGRAAYIRDLERQVHRSGATRIFIEAPYRNNRLLELLADTLQPSTYLCVASDITGPGESILTLTAAEWRTRRYDYNKIPTIFLIGVPARQQS